MPSINAESRGTLKRMSQIVTVGTVISLHYKMTCYTEWFSFPTIGPQRKSLELDGNKNSGISGVLVKCIHDGRSVTKKNSPGRARLLRKLRKPVFSVVETVVCKYMYTSVIGCYLFNILIRVRFMAALAYAERSFFCERKGHLTSRNSTKVQTLLHVKAYRHTSGKVKVNVDLYTDHTSKALRYGTRSQGISQFYPHTPRSSANEMNHTRLCLPSRSWYSFTDHRGIEGWVGLVGLGGFNSNIIMPTHTVYKIPNVIWLADMKCIAKITVVQWIFVS